MTKLMSMALVAGWLAVSAMAHDDGGLLESTVIGSTPGQMIGGVASGGAPWVVSEGRAALNQKGKLRLEVEGLIIPSLGSTGPVTSVSASVVCGGSGGTVVATTDAVPLTLKGNARIQDKVTLPASCIAPVILVRIAAINTIPQAQPGPFIAATGFNSTSGDDDKDKHDSTDSF